ncbi:hypothetical protein [Nitrosomonas sp. sh817]|uniref:hypothetical protein n=1 Tax=Nitrosomonas sp. sh817 TaxID=3070658 RepID=UPI0027DC1829|nr:hypothetical protein [Nitrosomonas sp. sh817]WMJ07325.1 hypothetical protein RBH92_07675 [Nitrosomonas sp. sh817]
MQPRIEKSIAIKLASELVPICVGLLMDYMAKRNGWIKMPKEFEQIRKNSNLDDSYVLAYEEENRILSCLMKSLFPGDPTKQLNQFDDEFQAIKEDEKLKFVDSYLCEKLGGDLFYLFEKISNATNEDQEIARKELEALSENEKREIFLSMQLFFAYIYAYFYNHIALMVHGQKLTTLVPLALKGDKKAFCRAIQIDRNILTGHPYFRDTYARLQTGEDPNFLNSVTAYIDRPAIKCRIDYPALYMLFAVLDGFKWLNDMKAREILDLYNGMGLNGDKGYIEDENSVIKKRIEYRNKQKNGY